ncbi:MAG: efflux RND transporter periplasmic adaptor subunit [Bacteroidota bacterium]|nr:efflux RND transporter periplasmic adaptor subunit [Bacteroidota bacterium]MDP4233791.1 efflux RND transporter periplasmic adaptor subunit [Bacteroidota bacterium]MDP4242430.1 efflux RND transporter periplasmic adaptor subunit [Bacteroidota bacterium]MDP4287552.1 efflux RND transporter periplasmic adaptor subunit [Bacteroidota bacterium]
MKYIPYLVIVTFISLAACKKAPPPPPPSAVQVGAEGYAVATEGAIESGPSISGTLVPRDQAVVRAQISGSVLKVFVDQGRNVKAGEIIATIDNSALGEAVQSARNAVTSAQNSLDVAKREQDRQEKLVTAGAISEQSVDQARRMTIAAEAALSQSKTQLANAQKQFSYATLRAPFSGVVSEKNVAAGDVVQPGTPMLTIVDPSTLELQGAVPANAIGLVHTGLEIQFSVTGYPGRQFLGKIARINPAADPMTRQVRIYAEIPNTGRALVAGLYAEGRVASEHKTTLMLPVDAVDRKTITPAVIRIVNDVVQRVPITLGTLDEQNNVIEITSGISVGDTVLRGPARDIGLGTHIKILPPKS